MAMPRGGAADGDATRAVLLDAAVRLFAEQGIEAVSVRAVNRAAGVAPAAVHYHFGSKAALLDAVVARHGEEVVADIGRRARQLLDATEPPTPRQVVEVLSDPYRRLLDRDPVSGRAWLGVIAQLSLTGDPRLAQPQADFNIALQAVARRAFPETEVRELERCMRLAVITLIQMLVQDGGTPADEALPLRPYIDVVVDFVAGGLTGAAAPGRLAPTVSPEAQG